MYVVWLHVLFSRLGYNEKYTHTRTLKPLGADIIPCSLTARYINIVSSYPLHDSATRFLASAHACHTPFVHFLKQNFLHG